MVIEPFSGTVTRTDYWKAFCAFLETVVLPPKLVNGSKLRVYSNMTSFVVTHIATHYRFE
ncbi:hypothetical protein BACI349Y_630010 [Bacillus sp. 349Y]|nr:hypothetical protein BACI349Y_630010 [Bacillus sp. 349Y]